MAGEHIATYLNDHLAGSTAAIELLEHLEKVHAGSGVGQEAARLRAEIEADRQELRAIMERLEADESRARGRRWFQIRSGGFSRWHEVGRASPSNPRSRAPTRAWTGVRH